MTMTRPKYRPRERWRLLGNAQCAGAAGRRGNVVEQSSKTPRRHARRACVVARQDRSPARRPRWQRQQHTQQGKARKGYIDGIIDIARAADIRDIIDFSPAYRRKTERVISPREGAAAEARRSGAGQQREVEAIAEASRSIYRHTHAILLQQQQRSFTFARRRARLSFATQQPQVSFSGRTHNTCLALACEKARQSRASSLSRSSYTSRFYDLPTARPRLGLLSQDVYDPHISTLDYLGRATP